MTSAILNRLYTSDGSEIILNTLQINVGSQSYCLVENFEDITAVTEKGETVTFLAAAMAIALPARNKDGTQDLQFAVSNIDGIVSTAIRNALANLNNGTLVMRQYISTDLSSPASPPIVLQIKDGYWNATEVQITAGFLNILKTAWPRYRYTLPVFPGLRYLQ
ncbi:DUF1833 family protein [Escherichia coli]|jgi:hypothetical protein|uniref:DUF1833 family protein n=1 Tax=Escherichia TaxID=561 RepID=UPI000A370EC5|nr:MULTISPECIES: DUF1833 family protein [Escherichia]DAE64520.1 MAG TPA: protein of unknown function DUF1833 [Caudoviricetes sp.]EFN3713269.1 DUF1833 domain-containing protein [Escherichia coli]EFN9967281.1 DUF1833 domain-containing protein [Escherichia coli]EGF4726950.1 DUF1833 domain-containing protein [Escherichia coli]EGG1044891.1 DUF1833 domain-containing protein [Escherichia coli]